MATKSITVNIDDVPTTIIIGPARKEDGIRRAEMMLEAVKMSDKELRKQVAFYQYPSCVNSVKSPVELKSMSFEDFLNKVDEASMDEWTITAYELNPQWKKAMETLAGMSEEDEKKTGMPSTGSLQPTEGQETNQETSQSSKS